jgi:hypothetical protein
MRSDRALLSRTEPFNREAAIVVCLHPERGARGGKGDVMCVSINKCKLFPSLLPGFTASFDKNGTDATNHCVFTISQEHYESVVCARESHFLQVAGRPNLGRAGAGGVAFIQHCSIANRAPSGESLDKGIQGYFDLRRLGRRQVSSVSIVSGVSGGPVLRPNWRHNLPCVQSLYFPSPSKPNQDLFSPRWSRHCSDLIGFL